VCVVVVVVVVCERSGWDAEHLVDLELVLAFVVPLLAHERADDLSDGRLQGKQPAAG